MVLEFVDQAAACKAVLGVLIAVQVCRMFDCWQFQVSLIALGCWVATDAWLAGGLGWWSLRCQGVRRRVGSQPLTKEKPRKVPGS